MLFKSTVITRMRATNNEGTATDQSVNDKKINDFFQRVQSLPVKNSSLHQLPLESNHDPLSVSQPFFRTKPPPECAPPSPPAEDVDPLRVLSSCPAELLTDKEMGLADEIQRIMLSTECALQEQRALQHEFRAWVRDRGHLTSGVHFEALRRAPSAPAGGGEKKVLIAPLFFDTTDV